MAIGRIRWKQGDYIKLGQAVAQFNRKVSQLEKENNSLFIPDKIDYKNAKSNIITRQGLNEYIRNLKLFQQKNAEQLIELSNGELISKWENDIININRANLQRTLTQRRKALGNPKYPTEEIQQINAQLNDLKNFHLKVGENFSKAIDRIMNNASSDYKFEQATLFRERYIRVMEEKYSSYKNYDKLSKKMNRIKNPMNFIKYIGNNDLIRDLTYQSEEYYTQEQFNDFVEMWDIHVDIDEDIIKIDNQQINVKEFNEQGNTSRNNFKKKKKGD